MNAGYYRADPRRSAAFAPIGSGWRWAFIVLVALGGLCFLSVVGLWTAAIVADPERPEPMLMSYGLALLFGAVLLLYVQAFVGMAWVYQAWKWLPWDQRYSVHWKGWISPGQAALLLLVPYFQYYWMFIVNPGLCDALDRLRVRYPTTEAAPKTLAIVASMLQIVIPIPVGGICWVLFMSKVEKMSREMSAAAAARANLAF